ncbi:hypothetical protein J31TS4_29620 [Paenibacillus sp. J31TS4]|uniref:cell division protein FtsQ/DivIB n=1 Tax=Paenibacillus sp. J31TS4 TaxID=2807195 RepID=UPI001B08E6E0|nr:FtsQ-type POTRA domain-containing protein [Paenibacillus sp. J31TS4]GIP39682.1 hypothetical protein J31TS4_29620 [Paenibacillus sp. J31TS4]
MTTCDWDDAVLQSENRVPVIKPDRPKKRGNRKLLFMLVVFFVTVLVILFFQTSISKISKIDIKGNSLVSTEQIGQASGIRVGDSFFTMKEDAAAEAIRSLDAIDTVTIDKVFPGQVTITVKEFASVAYQISESGQKEVLLADGTALPLNRSSLPADKPILSGWRADDPLKARLCAVLANIPPALLSDVSEIRPEPSSGFEDKIKLYTKSQFVVYTLVSLLPEKMPYMGVLIKEMQEKNVHSGVLTMIWQDRAGTP